MNNPDRGSAQEPSPPSPSPPSPVRLQKFLRPTDWQAFLLTLLCVWAGYYLTLAPELTLEDSGELATGSFYAGIPHPPGYPVWTIYTWLWTVLVPIKNVAWRVALGEATSGALAAGLLALLASRGSSLLLRGIPGLEGLSAKAENAICLVSGYVAGMLLGFNGFMWSQSVIVEVYSFSVASLMMVLLCLLRWIYAPNQRRYLYLALFFHGLSFTNHQTLIVAAMGVEVAIAAANWRMGRYLFLGNAIIYIAGLILKQQHILTALDQNQAILVIFHIVGVLSIGLYLWFTVLSQESFREYCLDAVLAIFFISLSFIPGFGLGMVVINVLALGALIFLAFSTRALGLEWLVVILCGCCWIAGAAFYFYMPLAGMTNPPMEWGYPRTVEGFIHAFTRGQYEKTHPTDLLHDPFRFLTQLAMLGEGIIEEFNWVYALLALVPFAFFLKLHKRERAWLVGLSAIYLCLGVLLLILLNPPPDRAAQQLVRVFFTASHTVIALMAGYGIALILGHLVGRYESSRGWALSGGALAAALAVFSFADLTSKTYYGENTVVTTWQLLRLTWQSFVDRAQFGLPVFAGLLLIALALAFIFTLWRSPQRAPLGTLLALMALAPLHSILTHWADNEQRGHWFGYYFGHDMFSPPFERPDHTPLYPQMSRNAVLFGGTDPGRFCPTYMIFCESFIPHSQQPAQDRGFDRRDVYIITQNALADGTYLEYIRAQYNRSAQVDPPFFQELFRSDKERRENIRTNLIARSVEPLDRWFEGLGGRIEKARRTSTSWFTAQTFLDLPGFAGKLRPVAGRDALSTFLYERLSPETRKLLVSASPGQFGAALARDLNRLLEREAEERYLQSNPAAAPPASETLYAPERFEHVRLSGYLQDFLAQNPFGSARIRLDRLLLETAYPGLIRPSLSGVYPDREIYIPTPEDSARAFNEYAVDAQRRLRLNQLRPGEEVSHQGDGVQISGTPAVMAINGLLTKVIFDHNPKNEFFVEESFPLDWMYPYLTPYGIIMKINRQPQARLTQECLSTDHEFWSRYCRRFIGDWIRDDTPIAEITKWSKQVYQTRNFRGFTGDKKFIRDDQAQKSFSKLRSSIAGLYYWRIATLPAGSAERKAMIREADFAFRQAYALCPYSPEALYRYINLLLLPEVNRVDDALLLARTSQELDPFNTSIEDLVHRLADWESQQARLSPEKLEKQIAANPGDYQASLELAGQYFQLGQTGAAVQALDRILNSTNVPTRLLRTLVPLYAALSNETRLRQTVGVLGSQLQSNDANLNAALGMVEGDRALGDTQAARQVLDHILNSSNLDAPVVLQAAEQLVAMVDYPRLERALDKLTKLQPDSPEAWYDLAALRSILGKSTQSVDALRRALQLSAVRLAHDPKARNLVTELQHDPRFNAVRSTPEFKSLMK